MVACWLLSSLCMTAVCCPCGLAATVETPTTPLLVSGRAAHSVLPSLASSLMAYITTFSQRAQMLASRFAPSALQTVCMLMTSASWPPARLSCKPSSTLWHHSVTLYTCKSVLRKRRQWWSPLGPCLQSPLHAMGSLLRRCSLSSTWGFSSTHQATSLISSDL